MWHCSAKLENLSVVWLSWSYICENSQHTESQPPTLLRSGLKFFFDWLKKLTHKAIYWGSMLPKKSYLFSYWCAYLTPCQNFFYKTRHLPGQFGAKGSNRTIGTIWDDGHRKVRPRTLQDHGRPCDVAKAIRGRTGITGHSSFEDSSSNSDNEIIVQVLYHKQMTHKKNIMSKSYKQLWSKHSETKPNRQPSLAGITPNGKKS